MGINVIGHIPFALSTEYIIESGQNLIAHSEEVMKAARGDYSKENIDYLAGIIAESKILISPTLVTSRNIISTFDNLEEKLKAAEIQYLHPMSLGIRAFINNMYLSMPEENRQWIRQGFEQFQLPFIKALYDAGVMIKGQYFSKEDIQNELDNISEHYTAIK